MTPEEALHEMEPRIKKIVTTYAHSDRDLRQDAAQEARIEVWRVLEKDSEASIPLLTYAALRRVQGFASGRNAATGEERTRYTRGGRGGMDPFRSPLITMSDIDQIGDDRPEHPRINTETMDAAFAIGDALSELPCWQAQYVALRYFLDMTNDQVAPIIGKSSGLLKKTWLHSIRPFLAKKLEYLR